MRAAIADWWIDLWLTDNCHPLSEMVDGDGRSSRRSVSSRFNRDHVFWLRSAWKGWRGCQPRQSAKSYLYKRIYALLQRAPRVAVENDCLLNPGPVLSAPCRIAVHLQSRLEAASPLQVQQLRPFSDFPLPSIDFCAIGWSGTIVASSQVLLRVDSLPQPVMTLFTPLPSLVRVGILESHGARLSATPSHT